MTKTNKKKPFSFSLSENMIERLHYYKKTHPHVKLSSEVESYLEILIPQNI